MVTLLVGIKRLQDFWIGTILGTDITVMGKSVEEVLEKLQKKMYDVGEIEVVFDGSGDYNLITAIYL